MTDVTVPMQIAVAVVVLAEVFATLLSTGWTRRIEWIVMTQLAVGAVLVMFFNVLLAVAGG